MKYDLDEIQKRMDSQKPEEPAPKGLPKSRKDRADRQKDIEIKKMKSMLDMGNDDESS